MEDEVYWQQLVEDAAADNDAFLREAYVNLERQLADGYELDDEGRVVRLNPALPDYVTITALAHRGPYGLYMGPADRRVRVPVHADRPSPSTRTAPQLRDSHPTRGRLHREGIATLPPDAHRPIGLYPS